MTHTEVIKKQMNDAKQKVMNLLKWDELKYAEFQEKQGYSYLMLWLDGDEFGINQQSHSRGFWVWWRNQWFKRDNSFLLNAESLKLSEREWFYTVIHDAEKIDYTPHISVTITPVVDSQTTKIRELGELLRRAEQLQNEIENDYKRVSK